MNVVFYANIILRTHVCICMCVYLTYKCYIAMEISSRGSTYPEMFCALERFDSAQFLSHATRTHILPFPRTRSKQNTQTHLNPMNPIFFFFFPLVYLPLLACLGSVLLFQDCSVHLLIRSTGSSGNVQTLLSSQLAERVTLHHCVPPWPWNPNTLSHRRHKPSLPAQLARTPSLHQTRSGCRCQALLQTPASVCSGCKDDGMKFNIPKEPIKFHVLRFTLLVILNILNMLFEYFSKEEGENLITFLGNCCELFCIYNV